MAATLLMEEKRAYPDGAIVQIRIWLVSGGVPPSTHALKYSLFYGYPGRRVVAFDNERGKGDHRHLDDVESPYAFVSVEQLIADFLDEVRKRRDRDG